MRNCEVQTIATDDGISTGRRGFRSHHVVTEIDESGHINTIAVHPHGLAGFEAALAQVQKDPRLHLKYALSHIYQVIGQGIHGKKKGREEMALYILLPGTIAKGTIFPEFKKSN